MSENWANRQRKTNRLVRKIAKYVFQQSHVTPTQLYGLSQLSWITTNNSENESYIKSTKIPALGNIFNKDYKSLTLEEVSNDIAIIMEDDFIANLIQEHTGFTHFYKAFRKSSLPWLEQSFDTLLPMYKAAYSATNNKNRKELVKGISNILGIPKANHPETLMKPEYFLTPTFFALDKEIKFPIINGSKGVEELLKGLKVRDNDLVTQYVEMVKLYGVGRIEDAADLDQVGLDLPDFIDTPKQRAKKSLLKHKKTKSINELPLKDENDIEVIHKAGKITQRRIHNQLTNLLSSSLPNYKLLEGRDKSCMFDVLVKNYDGKNDLIIEVKSSLEMPNIRMAIGQLFNYWFELNGDTDTRHIAILLPETPNDKCINFLKWMNIGLLWFYKNKLHTSSECLEHLAIKT